MPSALFSTLLASPFVCAVVADVTPTYIWAIWLAAMYLQTGVRFLSLLAFRRAAPSIDALPRWGKIATIGTLVSGTLWGSAVYWLVPTATIDYQLLIALVVAVLATTSGFAASSYVPAFFAFYLPTMPPLAVLMLMQNDRLRLLMGWLLVFYIPIFIGFYFRMHRAFLNTQTLRFENEELARRLAERNREVEEANAAKSTFLAAASHDLRQPLHALSLFVETLRTRPLPETEKRLVENIDSAVSAMDDLFDALLDVSKLDAGAVVPNVRTFPAQQVLDRIALAYTGAAAAKGLQLRVRPTTLWLRSDPVLVEEALRNLVSNAVRYTHQGGILVACRASGTHHFFQVTDTGIGIAENQQRAVFREFVQVGNTERNRENGLGLGLAIVDRLARVLDGSVSLNSKLGRGSSFRLRIPKAVGLGSAGDTVGLPKRSSHTRFDEVRILLLDDEPQVRIAMCGLLNAWGAKVIDADTVEDLLARAATSGIDRPDLIIADYRLRAGANGIDAIAVLRDEWNTKLPALILTGDTSPELIRHFSATGHAFLTKPARADDLRAMLAALLRAAPKDVSPN